MLHVAPRAMYVLPYLTLAQALMIIRLMDSEVIKTALTRLIYR